MTKIALGEEERFKWEQRLAENIAVNRDFLQFSATRPNASNPWFWLSPEWCRQETAAWHSKRHQHNGKHMAHASPQAFNDAVPALADLKPRVLVEVVAELTGLKRRTITDLASKKQIPGAVKLGETWTFDQDLLALWLKKETNGTKRLHPPKQQELPPARHHRRERIPRVASHNF